MDVLYELLCHVHVDLRVKVQVERAHLGLEVFQLQKTEAKLLEERLPAAQVHVEEVDRELQLGNEGAESEVLRPEHLEGRRIQGDDRQEVAVAVVYEEHLQPFG